MKALTLHRLQGANPLVYRISAWDNYPWFSCLINSPKTLDMLVKANQKIPDFSTFAAEFCHRIVAHSPVRMFKHEIRPEAEWATILHNHLDSFPEMLELVAACRRDRYLIGLATHLFAQGLLSMLPLPPSGENIQQKRREVAGLMDMKKLLSADMFPDETAIAQLEKALARAIGEGRAIVQEMEAYSLGLSTPDFRTSLNDLLNSVVAEISAQKDTLDFMFSPGDDSGADFGAGGTSGSINEKMALAKKISSSGKLKQIMTQAGRIKRLREASGKRKSSDPEGMECTPVWSMGGDLSKIEKGELLYALEDDLFDLFCLKFLEGQLRQFSLSSEQQMGSGPVIVCLDSSGSMQGIREIWAKAVALNISAIAAGEGRDFAIIHFDSRISREDTFLAENRLSRAAEIREQMLQSLSFFTGGGTDFSYPLDRAIQLIRSSKVWTKADIILLTDGQDNLTQGWIEQFNAEKVELKFTLYSVVIETSTTRCLKDISDHLTLLQSIGNDAGIVDVLNDI